MNTSVRKHLLGVLAIFIFGGVIQVTVFEQGAWDNLRYFSINFIYSGVFWVFLWKGSEFLVDALDPLYPWLEAPIKRVVASLLGISVLIFVAIWSLELFFDLVVFGRTWEEAVAETNTSYTHVFLITLLVNIVMHGRSFLFSWRQAAIDVERLKTEQVSMQYQSLRNQVNPHFLFNSFNVLSSLVYDDQEKAVAFIKKLSEVYRYVLDKKDEEVVPVKDELAFTRNFVFLQQIRFGDNLKVKIDEPAVDAYLPPLAIQLLVENAIKHNVVSENDPLEISICFKEDRCIVRNTLKEKLSKDSTGIGLNNLKERYGYLTDQGLEISKTDTHFEATLPLLNLRS